MRPYLERWFSTPFVDTFVHYLAGSWQYIFSIPLGLCSCVTPLYLFSFPPHLIASLWGANILTKQPGTSFMATKRRSVGDNRSIHPVLSRVLPLLKGRRSVAALQAPRIDLYRRTYRHYGRTPPTVSIGNGFSLITLGHESLPCPVT